MSAELITRHTLISVVMGTYVSDAKQSSDLEGPEFLEYLRTTHKHRLSLEKDLRMGHNEWTEQLLKSYEPIFVGHVSESV